jgi:CRISPR system Cascade subunit CasA
MFNIIKDPWIPVIKKSGERKLITPAGLVDRYAEDPVLALDSSRPDFNGALIQFLIGLVQTTFPPANESEWRKKFSKPPTSDELKSAFGHYAHTFNLDGTGPRFMQDLDFIVENLSQKERVKIEFPIEELVLEMPGDITKIEDRDFFVKRGKVKTICPSCCASALYTLQTHAPSGGPGYRFSLRGGSPLTTIVLGRTLWETVWLNVVNSETFNQFGNKSKQADSDKFPWMGKTRTSEKDQITTFQDVNGAQMFWGMPWRIKIPFENSNMPVECDLCGEMTNSKVSTFYRKNYGINYKGGWYHTLTPYKDGKDAEIEPRPFESEVNGISYRHWLGLIQNNPQEKIRPATVIHTFKERKDHLEEIGFSSTRLWAFGYKMKQRKALCWNDSTMPIITVIPAISQEYEFLISQLITSADMIITKLRRCVRDAMFDKKSKVSGDFSIIESRFWQDTEPVFYQVLEDSKTALEQKQSLDVIKLGWLKLLKKKSIALFDNYSQAEQIVTVTNPCRIINARKDLLIFLNSSTKLYDTLHLSSASLKTKAPDLGKKNLKET